MCALVGLGATLYQNQDGVGWVIGCVGRSLSKTECKHLSSGSRQALGAHAPYPLHVGIL